MNQELHVCTKNTIARTLLNAQVEIIGSPLYRLHPVTVIRNLHSTTICAKLNSACLEIPHRSEESKRERESGQSEEGLWTAARHLSALISSPVSHLFLLTPPIQAGGGRQSGKTRVNGGQRCCRRQEQLMGHAIYKIWIAKYLNNMKTDKANYTVRSAMHKTTPRTLSPWCANSSGSPLW